MAKETTAPLSVADILKDVAKKHNLRVGSLSEVTEPVIGLTTGNLTIDWETGVGGLPIGRSVEMYGLPSSGKTTTALQAAAALQHSIIAEGRDEHILYLDHEHAMDGDYAAALGLDVEHPSFLLAQPYSLEQGAETALKIIDSGQVRLAIWDSVASMAPIARLEGEFDQRTAAMNKARLMSGLLLQLTPLLHKNRCCGVFINHLMESIDMNGRPGLPPKVDTPGGKGLKFYASLRMEFRQIKNVKGKAEDALVGDITDQTVATLVKVKIVKNRVGPPFREAEVCVRFGKGFDNAWSAVQVLVAHKQIVASSTGHFYFDKGAPAHPDMLNSATGRPFIRGEAALLHFADTHLQWREDLITCAVDLIKTYDGQTLASQPTTVEDDLMLLGPDVDLT